MGKLISIVLKRIKKEHKHIIVRVDDTEDDLKIVVRNVRTYCVKELDKRTIYGAAFPEIFLYEEICKMINKIDN